jgi:hypothetical protein
MRMGGGGGDSVRFLVMQPSYLRVFAEAGENSDVDFYIYGGPNATQLIYFSIGTQSYESALFEMTPQHDPFVLIIHFFSVPLDVDCPYLHFELAMKPNYTVLAELDCPSHALPPAQANPPQFINLPVGGQLEVASSDYYFTRSQLISGGPNAVFFEYRIRLDLPASTTVIALIAFDFLANDFNLYFTSPDGSIAIVRYHHHRNIRSDWLNDSFLFVCVCVCVCVFDV